MREIDNKLNSVNFKGIQKPSVEEVTTPEVAPASNAETKEIKNLLQRLQQFQDENFILN